MARPVVLEGKKCPLCGGNEFWDNRSNKKNPKAPDFKCANKDCRDEKGFSGALWEDAPKEKKAAKVPAEIKRNTVENDLYAILQVMNAKLDKIAEALKSKPVVGTEEENGWDGEDNYK